MKLITGTQFISAARVDLQTRGLTPRLHPAARCCGLVHTAQPDFYFRCQKEVKRKGNSVQGGPKTTNMAVPYDLECDSMFLLKKTILV